MNNRIFLLLGTNLGDRKINFDRAIHCLEKSAGRILAKSSIYQTAAWGKSDQPEFYNQVLEIETKLNAPELLAEILSIESVLGRKREEKWGERLIDIDILLFGTQIINTESLSIPHPQMTNRRFTLIPLAEIASDVIHPVLQKSIGDLLIECKDGLAVNKLP